MDHYTLNSIGNTAEAIKAIAETGGKGFDLTRDLLRLISPAAEQGISILTDRLAVIRFENAAKLTPRVQRVMNEHGIRNLTRVPSLNFVLPLLNHATLEESDELQEKWARLLVNAGDASTEMELRTAYVEMLASMSAFDVRILSEMAKAVLAASEDARLGLVETWNLPHSAKLVNRESPEGEKASREVGVSLANLCRLGCLAPGTAGFGGGILFNMMIVTDLGQAFYLACK